VIRDISHFISTFQKTVRAVGEKHEWSRLQVQEYEWVFYWFNY
jgi:hypothetical protein